MFRICNGSNFRELIFLCFTLEKKMEVPALHVELTCSALSTMTLYLYQYLYQSPRVAAFKRGFLDFWEYQKTFQQVQKFLRESIPPTSMGTHFKMMCLSKCFKVVLRHFFFKLCAYDCSYSTLYPLPLSQIFFPLYKRKVYCLPISNKIMVL